MRKGQAKARIVVEDPIYKNKLVTKLINRSMKDGKKSVAQKQIYKALEIIKEQSQEDPLKIFVTAIEQIKPNMEVRARRIGGAAYQVPQPVRGPRKEALAIRWLVANANLKPNAQFKSYGAKLAQEIMDAAKGEGGAVAKKKDMERQAEANKAFAHFRW
jgi:small subunit ribosomal protein S7